MKASEIREKFLKFFESKQHQRIKSASLIPHNDPTVLFTTAGMQQFKPYYTGQADPMKDFGSMNTVSVQKCVRTSDIDEVGDETHLTFFEMLGNFSFGGYWKQEAIAYAHEFITKELELKIDYVSVFKGDDETPGDSESRNIWSKIDPSLTIKDHDRKDNFWGPTGDEGPCGPTTEIYINGVEIWNIVFNEYFKTKDGKYTPLETKGIDTGMGLERLLVQVQKKNNVYETDIFEDFIKSLPNDILLNKKRILADHVRAMSFMICDGVRPSNKGAGYILRRLMRRILAQFSFEVVQQGIEWCVSKYPDLKLEEIKKVVDDEWKQFTVALNSGLKELNKLEKIDSETAFRLYSSYGLPVDVIKDKFPDFDSKAFNKEFEKHQDLSRTASAGQFKGGLASHSEKVVRLHTTTHLMNAALRKVLGDQVMQKGSNITEERTRFDFNSDAKLTDEQKKEVESLVNNWILADLSVKKEIMSIEEARKLNAVGAFGEKYSDTVSIYTIFDPKTDKVVSREFCGGPHVEHTGVIGKFKIQKEEAVSAGVRRIKAIIE